MTIADVNSEARSLCDADSTSYTAADLLRRVNASLETCIAKIISADGTWQYDDTNYTDLPIGKGTLTSGQNVYSFAGEFLDIEQVEVLNLTGSYLRITPFDAIAMGVSFDEYFNITTSGAQSGFPLYYDKQGDTIRLSSAPTATYCTLTNGLRVRFKRTADLFTTAQVTTGTKEPGIASPYHALIAYMAAVPYCMSYKKDRVALYEKKVDAMTKDMLAFYSRREKDKRFIMTPKRILYI